MELLVNILIFCIVLFLYTHIYFHLKTSDDLEMYEIDKPSKVKLEEICDLRQPVLFNYENEKMSQVCCRENINDNYGAFDVKIRNVKLKLDEDDDIYVPISFVSSQKAMNEDVEGKYIIENNGDFLEETGILKTFRYNDLFLRPYMVSMCMYDYMSGSNGTCTPLRYDINYRNYYLVTEGSVDIKLTPPRSSKYLHITNDYENFEFRSPLNLWNIQSEYKTNFDKIKSLDITLKKGQILFIPSYWLYTIRFNGSSSVCSFKYRTYMNTISIFPQLFMRFLQYGNVERNVVHKKNDNNTLVKDVVVDVIVDEKKEKNNEKENKKENKKEKEREMEKEKEKEKEKIEEKNIISEDDNSSTYIDNLPIQ